MDAVLVTRNIYSFAELSLSPVFRRQWPSLYEALDDCRPNRNKLMKLYLREIPTNKRPIIAGDHTPWPRTEAPTLKERKQSPLSLTGVRTTEVSGSISRYVSLLPFLNLIAPHLPQTRSLSKFLDLK